MSTHSRPPAGVHPAGGAPVTGLAATDLSDLDLAELAQVLGLVEDFLRQAGTDVVDELAAYSPARPADPSRWVDWVADILGEHAITLLALHHATTASPAPAPNGEPR